MALKPIDLIPNCRECHRHVNECICSNKRRYKNNSHLKMPMICCSCGEVLKRCICDLLDKALKEVKEIFK